MLRLRELAVSATYRGSAELPTPPELEMWAKDLRRGRASIVGSVVRFIRMVEQRGMGAEGRRIALEATALTQEYIDLVLPEQPSAGGPVNQRAVDISSETRKARGVNYGRLSDRVANRSA